MSIISKQVTDRAIQANFGPLWVLLTLDIMPLKQIPVAILNFGGNGKCWFSQKPLEIE